MWLKCDTWLSWPITPCFREAKSFPGQRQHCPGARPVLLIEPSTGCRTLTVPE